MKHENIKHETQCYLHGVSSNPESYRKREASQIPGNSNFVSSVSWKLVYGICETKFKLRHANHKKSFNHRNCRSDTELSNNFWKIKDNKTQRKHNMGDFRQTPTYNTTSKRCSLCLNEKLKIALHRNNNMLNRRTEILNKGRHKNKYALISFDS